MPLVEIENIKERTSNSPSRYQNCLKDEESKEPTPERESVIKNLFESRSHIGTPPILKIQALDNQKNNVKSRPASLFRRTPNEVR